MRMGMKRLLHGHGKLSGPRFHEPIEPAGHILFEVRGVAVKLQRRLVSVLLVEEKSTRVLDGLVANVQQASGFLSRMQLHGADILFALRFRTGLYQHVDFKNNHLLLTVFFRAESSSANSGRNMV